VAEGCDRVEKASPVERVLMAKGVCSMAAGVDGARRGPTLGGTTVVVAVLGRPLIHFQQNIKPHTIFRCSSMAIQESAR
jgi:hypothetical protein